MHPPPLHPAYGVLCCVVAPCALYAVPGSVCWAPGAQYQFCRIHGALLCSLILLFRLLPSAVRFPLPVIPPIRACTLSLWDYIHHIRCIAMSAPLTYANRRCHRVPCPGILLTHQEHSEREARSLFYLYVNAPCSRAPPPGSRSSRYI